MQNNVIPLTGAYHNGTYVWAIAMNLAWNEMVVEQLGGELNIETHDAAVRKLVDNFNTGIFSKELLEAAAYFVCSGMGDDAVVTARARLLHEKSVSNSMLDGVSLSPGELFSYARVEKMLSWVMIFQPCMGEFMGRKVEAFKSGNGRCSGVHVMQYRPSEPEKTVVCLYANDGKDQVFIMGGYTPGKEGEMVARLNNNDWGWGDPLNYRDTLIIPAVDLKVSREYPELLGQRLINPCLPEVFLSKMNEEIRFSMNEKGVEFVAEAEMMATRSMPPRPKIIVYDRPFLIVIKQRDQELPYLVIGVNNLDPLKLIATNRRLGAGL